MVSIEGKFLRIEPEHVWLMESNLYEADVEEFKALREYNEFLQKQLSEKEERFVEQTGRLRSVQDELFKAKEDISKLSIELALKRCEKKKCGQREPSNGY